MIDKDKTKKQLIGELVELRAIVSNDKRQNELKEALNNSELKFKNLFELVPVAVALTRLKTGELVDINSKFCKIFGYSKNDILNNKSTDIGFYTIQNSVKYKKSLNQTGVVNGLEMNLPTKDGSLISTLLYAKIITLSCEQFILIILHDINTKKQKATEEWKATFNSTNDMISLQDNEYNIIRCNKAFSDFFKVDEKLPNVNKCYKLIHNTDKPPENCLCHQVLKYKKHYSCQMYEPSLKAYLQINYSPLLDENEKLLGIMHIIRDLTEQKKMEEELLKIRKIESIRVLAGGIAHDYNNLLQGVLGNIQYVIHYGNLKETYKESLEDARSAGQQAADLTRQLLTFAKNDKPNRKSVVSVYKLLRKSSNFSLHGSKVNCKLLLPNDLWNVKVDKGQINQVINNLIINANQSMPFGGTIQISAKNTLVTEKDNIQLDNGKYIKISVEDKGYGIAEKIIDKIFDPYFTTKDKGQGLGLATCYIIIKNHEGLISVKSEIDVGSVFDIYLPASEEKLLPSYNTEELLPIEGKGKILLMDDDMYIRHLMERLLNKLGYEVELTKDGNETIKLYKKDYETNKTFDAVILDLTIPGGIGGQATIKKLVEINPEIKAIVISGYSNDDIMTNYKKYGFKDVVDKPFDPKRISEVINTLLG